MFEITSSADRDYLAEHLSANPCRLYYDPRVPISQIHRHQTLQSVIDIVNEQWASQGRDFVGMPHNRYWAANLVRINIYRHSLASQGNRKPMLLIYNGELPYVSNTGDTRLMAAEGLTGFDCVSAFISTHQQYRDRFQHLQEIRSFNDFQHCADIKDGTQCWFRFANPGESHGVDWYEISLHQPGVSVPSEEWCLDALSNYLINKPATFRFTREWMAKYRDWHAYARLPA